MPADSPNWGGERAGAGNPGGIPARVRERSGYVERLEQLEARAAAQDDRPGKTPRAISVMRQRMNFHLWRAGIVQKRVQAPGAENAATYKADLAELEYHLEKAD